MIARLAGGAAIALVGFSIVSGLREAMKDAQIEAGRRSGRLPPRWTDANRWEKD